MYIDSDSLKKWYCQERKYLETLPVFKKEEMMATVLTKKTILNRVGEIKAEYLLDKFNIPHLVNFMQQRDVRSSMNRFFIDFSKQDQAKIAEDIDEVSKVEIKKSPDGVGQQYALYFYQLEKIKQIEVELKKRNLEPEEVYKEKKQ